MITAESIKRRARELGFDLCGVAAAAQFPELGRLSEWLRQGYGGEMAYLERTVETRADIRRFLPSARSVILTATLYDPSHSTGSEAKPDVVHIARYARGADYHRVLPSRLRALIAWMRDASGAPFESAVFTDKHPVQERAFAARAGLGWIGKNTCLINRTVGSWLLLGGVACSLDLEPDAPSRDHCGTCTRCLEACPTGALVEPRLLDATRCISYLTIELDGPIPEALRPAVGNHMFGCDICQEVCPWNAAPAHPSDPVWAPAGERASGRASELYQRADHELHGFVEGSAMTYTSLSRLRRNLAVVIGNSGNPALAAALDRPGGGIRNAAPSADTPVVGEHVAWAKQRLSGLQAPADEG